MVIGGRDSGRTMVQHYYGQGPEAAYTGRGKHDVASRGDVGLLIWVVGSDGPADAEAFLQRTRSRYLQTQDKVQGDANQRAPALIVKERALEYIPAPNGWLVRVDGGAGSLFANRLVIAAGPESQGGTLFESPGDRRAITEPVTARLPNLPGTRKIAKKVPGRSQYVSGAAATSEKGIVGKDETYSTSENQASLYALRNRNVALADKLAAEPRAKGAVDTSQVGRADRVLLGPTGRPDAEYQPGASVDLYTKPIAERQVARSASQSAGSTNPTPSRLHGTAAPELLLKVQMADALDKFRFPGIERLTITVSATPTGGLKLSSPELSFADLDRFAGAIQENGIAYGDGSLIYELRGVVASGRPIRFEVDVRSSPNIADPNVQGTIQPGSITLVR
jgi:hypothetical protein